MPLTLPAHPAPALWLKLRFPGRLAGVGLAAGSVVPDLEYLIRAQPHRDWGHSLPGLFSFCLPAGLMLTWLAVRVVLKPLCLHLPACGPLDLPQYWRVEEGSRRPGYWMAAAAGVLVGAASHLAWDSFTHHEGWMLHVLGLAGARMPLCPGGAPLDRLLWLISTVAGSLYVLLIALPRITRERLLDEWHGPPATQPPVPTWRSHAWLWSVSALGCAAGAAWGFHRYGIPDLKWGWWFAWLIALEAMRGLILSLPLACLLARRWMGPALPPLRDPVSPA